MTTSTTGPTRSSRARISAIRIAWLQSIRIPERDILAALGNPADPDLDEFARDAAHEIAAEILDNGGTEFAA